MAPHEVVVDRRAGLLAAAALLREHASSVDGSVSIASVTGIETCLVAFFVGAIAAGALLGPHTQAIGRRYGVALLVEAGLLGTAPLVATEQQNLPIAMILAAGACGLQNGMFSNYRGMVLRTSHMTGTLTDLGVLLGCRGYRNGQAWKGVLLATTGGTAGHSQILTADR